MLFNTIKVSQAQRILYLQHCVELFFDANFHFLHVGTAQRTSYIHCHSTNRDSYLARSDINIMRHKHHYHTDSTWHMADGKRSSMMEQRTPSIIVTATHFSSLPRQFGLAGAAKKEY
jgi:hypothetical protein